MLSSKQRALLRAAGNQEETILHIGKDGVTENVIAQAKAAIIKRELLKGRVLESSGLSAREACDAIAQEIGAEGVQIIGSRFLLYKKSEENKYKI